MAIKLFRSFHIFTILTVLISQIGLISIAATEVGAAAERTRMDDESTTGREHPYGFEFRVRSKVGQRGVEYCEVFRRDRVCCLNRPIVGSARFGELGCRCFRLRGLLPWLTAHQADRESRYQEWNRHREVESPLPHR